MIITGSDATFSVIGNDGRYHDIGGVYEVNPPRSFADLNKACNNAAIEFKGLSSAIGSISCKFSTRI